MSAVSTPSRVYADPPAPRAVGPAPRPRRQLDRFSESGSALLAVMLLVLGAYATVLAGWPMPPLAQVAIAFSGLELVPGLGLAHLLLRDGEAEWPGGRVMQRGYPAGSPVNRD